jgi:hypothetical protein
MKDGSTLLEVFEKEQKDRIANFGFPDWLNCECQGCRLPLGTESIMSVEVHFEPMFLGDISFNYFCKTCCSAFSRYLKCDIKNISEIAGIFALKTCPAPIVDNTTLFDPAEHNIIKKIVKEQKS